MVYKSMHYLLEAILFTSASALFGWSNESMSWIVGIQGVLLIALEYVHERRYPALQRTYETTTWGSLGDGNV